MASFRVPVLILLLVTAGCATYQPVELARVKPQENVRLELDAAELGRLIAYSDPGTASVHGRVVAVTSDSVAIVLRTPLSYAQVSVSRSSILGVGLKTVDNRQTFAFSALLVGGVAVLAYLGFDGGGSSVPGEGDGPDEFRPLGFRLPFSLSFGR